MKEPNMRIHFVCELKKLKNTLFDVVPRLAFFFILLKTFFWLPFFLWLTISGLNYFHLIHKSDDVIWIRCVDDQSAISIPHLGFISQALSDKSTSQKIKIYYFCWKSDFYQSTSFFFYTNSQFHKVSICNNLLKRKFI